MVMKEPMLVIGLNHRTAPIGIREKFYLNSLQSDFFLSKLKNNPKISEAFVLSTCNRIEVYLSAIDDTPIAHLVMGLIAKIKNIDFDKEYLKYIYTYQEAGAINHLMRVVTGLDSLVLGERQILGQFKTSVDRARTMGMISKCFNLLTNVAIRAGKKAQYETDISVGGSSLSWAAIEMAEQKLETLKDKKALLIGAGKMGELALKDLCSRGLSKIYLMNRTGEKAELIAARFGGIAVSFWDIKHILTEVDLCICSVGAPHYILDAERISTVMQLRHNRDLVLIDISMPRNIEPQAGLLPQVFLSSIDDLAQAVNAGMQKRQAAIPQVEAIIDQKIIEFYQKIRRSFQSVP